MHDVIRNVCIHVNNEQPLLCDLYEMPSSDDAGLVCTNVRSLDGKRPVFIDQIGSTFFFPYHVVRFLEIPASAMAAYRASGARSPAHGAAADGSAMDDADGGTGPSGLDNGTGQYGDDSLLPIAVGAPAGSGTDDADLDLEIDEDFLQRVRDI
jgi:hypothetical protein